MAVLQTHSSMQSNDLTTRENFFNDVLTKKAAIFNGNFGVLKDVKVTGDKMGKTMVEIEMAILEAIRAAELAFLKTFASKAVSLMDLLPDDAVPDFIQVSLINCIAEMLLPLLAKGTAKSYPTAEGIDKYNFVPGFKGDETVGTPVGHDLLNKYASPVHRIRSLSKTPPSSSNRL